MRSYWSNEISSRSRARKNSQDLEMLKWWHRSCTKYCQICFSQLSCTANCQVVPGSFNEMIPQIDKENRREEDPEDYNPKGREIEEDRAKEPEYNLEENSEEESEYNQKNASCRTLGEIGITMITTWLHSLTVPLWSTSLLFTTSGCPRSSYLCTSIGTI